MAVNLSVKGRNCVVVGANASGAALAKFLLKKGAAVSLVDGGHFDAAQAYLSEKLDLSKIRLEVGEFNPQTFEQSTLIVVAQGIPLDLKILEVARNAGIPVYSELEFFSLFVEEPIIAVAGTKGKSTTAYILKTFLEASGKSVFSNYNQPLSEYLNQSKSVDYLVLTTNSFQLEGLQHFKPQMVLFLNLSEDHLNRYPNFETYLAANREVLKNLDAQSTCILNATDNHVTNFSAHLPSRKLYFSNQALPEGIEGGRVQKNDVTLRLAHMLEPVKYDLTMCRLRGTHNKENFLAAALAAHILGVTESTIRSCIEQLRAVPHRLQFVKRINSVAFYDDSCASNPQAVIRSLQAFVEPVILISGGRDKNADYTPMTSHIRQRVKNLILVGEAKEKMNRMLGDFTETFLVGTMEEAVLLAYQKSRSGDIVLLSPAADSSDAFSSHEERGDQFQKLVSLISQPRKPNVI